MLIHVIDHGACTIISHVPFNPNPGADLVLTSHNVSHHPGMVWYESVPGVAFILLSCYLTILLSYYVVAPTLPGTFAGTTRPATSNILVGVGRHPEHGAQHDVWHVRTLNRHIILDLSHAEALTLCIAFAVGAKCASFATTRTIDN